MCIPNVVVLRVLIAAGHHPMVSAFTDFFEDGGLCAIRKSIGTVKLNIGWIASIKQINIHGGSPIIWVCVKNRTRTI